MTEQVTVVSYSPPGVQHVEVFPGAHVDVSVRRGNIATIRIYDTTRRVVEVHTRTGVHGTDWTNQPKEST